jgi:hypothetical protein
MYSHSLPLRDHICVLYITRPLRSGVVVDDDIAVVQHFRHKRTPPYNPATERRIQAKTGDDAHVILCCPDAGIDERQ